MGPKLKSVNFLLILYLSLQSCTSLPFEYNTGIFFTYNSNIESSAFTSELSTITNVKYLFVFYYGGDQLLRGRKINTASRTTPTTNNNIFTGDQSVVTSIVSLSLTTTRFLVIIPQQTSIKYVIINDSLVVVKSGIILTSFSAPDRLSLTNLTPNFIFTVSQNNLLQKIPFTYNSATGDIVISGIDYSQNFYRGFGRPFGFQLILGYVKDLFGNMVTLEVQDPSAAYATISTYDIGGLAGTYTVIFDMIQTAFKQRLAVLWGTCGNFQTSEECTINDRLALTVFDTSFGLSSLFEIEIKSDLDLRTFGSSPMLGLTSNDEVIIFYSIKDTSELNLQLVNRYISLEDNGIDMSGEVQYSGTTTNLKSIDEAPIFFKDNNFVKYSYNNLQAVFTITFQSLTRNEISYKICSNPISCSDSFSQCSNFVGPIQMCQQSFQTCVYSPNYLFTEGTSSVSSSSPSTTQNCTCFDSAYICQGSLTCLDAKLESECQSLNIYGLDYPNSQTNNTVTVTNSNKITQTQYQFLIIGVPILTFAGAFIFGAIFHSLCPNLCKFTGQQQANIAQVGIHP